MTPDTRPGDINVREVTLDAIAAMRDAFRSEMNCQIVHDSIHYRRGWSREYAILEGDHIVGYASLAVAGPWQDKPTFYELYVIPEHRARAYAFCQAFFDTTQPPAYEVQSSDSLTTTMALNFASSIATERIVFRDHIATNDVVPGASLRRVTPADEIRTAIEKRQGGGEWILEVDGVEVGTGGILFHYNPPYGDVYMNIGENFRQRGYGSYLVQELKRLCSALGAIPAARSSPTNIPSHRTLQKAGMIPYAHILYGRLNSFRATSSKPAIASR